MRLTVPIAIAATYVAFSTNALPTVDRQQPFLSHTQLDAPLHLNSTLNQQYSGHQVLILTATNQQELSALDALRQVDYHCNGIETHRIYFNWLRSNWPWISGHQCH